MTDLWAYLPKDLLVLILERLFLVYDYARFTAVCKSWLSAAFNQNQKQSRLKSSNKQLPLLMIRDQARNLYGITRDKEGKFYNFRLWVPYNKRCCGSSNGWLATVEENFGVTLLNPFSEGTLCLPPICGGLGYYRDAYQYAVKKVIFSANPSSSPCDDDDFMVVAIFGIYFNLAFIQPGKSEGWTLLRKFAPVDDVIIYNGGRIYAVNQKGEALSINFDTQTNPTCPFKSKIVVPKPEPQERLYFVESHLVESSGGDLLLVHRYKDNKDDTKHWSTVSFKVYKMVSDSEKEGKHQWLEIKCLADGDALFLGDSHSMCVSALSFPGCQSNCIYYTENDFSFSHYYGPLWASST